jgi:hypothetical protein
MVAAMGNDGAAAGRRLSGSGSEAHAHSPASTPEHDRRSIIARHKWMWLLAAAVVTATLWFSHLPSLLFHAQLYADDGGWYQGAYGLGPIRSLPHPAAGYLVTFQRLIASISLALPIVAVPTFFNLVAVAVEAVGVCYLLSWRMAAAIPSVAVRAAIALLALALPNAYDTSASVTASQWHLALIAFLVVFATVPRRLTGWILDVAILLIGGLTGPYCILLEPVIGVMWLRRRADRRLRLLLLGNSLCAVIQLVVIAVRLGSQRSAGPLDAGLLTFVEMIGRQVTLGLVIGAHGLAQAAGSPLASNAAILTLLTVFPFAVCGWAAWRGPVVLRAFCFFAGAELLLALLAPSIAAPRWPSLAVPASIEDFHPGGIRYFSYPLLAFAMSLGWIAVTYAGPGFARLWRRTDATGPPHPIATARLWLGRAAGGGAAALLLASVVIGMRVDWVHPPYLDEHWNAQVARFQAAPPGSVVVIPINPQGWDLTLTAR